MSYFSETRTVKCIGANLVTLFDKREVRYVKKG